MTNPLLDFTSTPRFDAIRPEHVEPAIRELIDENHALIDRLVADPATPSWESFIVPLMIDAEEKLDRAWGVVNHMQSVMNSPEWREAYNLMLPEVSRFHAEVGQNQGLYEKFKALYKSAEFATLPPIRRRIIEHALRDFRLAGAELDEAQKPRFKEIQEELSALSAKFSENLLDATNAHAEWIEDESQLAGLPEDVKAAARTEAEKAEKAGKPGWKLTLQMPAFMPVMQYADDRALRERMYRAFATRASEFGPEELDNGPLIGRILALRAEKAALLGYNNYAEVSLIRKMAETPQEVLDFLHEMATRAKPFAEKDLETLRAFAADELGLTSLEPWDIAYASEKLRQARYDFSEQEVKQYFPAPRVLYGLFGVIQKLFSVDIVAEEAPVWDPETRFFRIERDGRLIGNFFLDLHARESKRGGAWMDSARSRMRHPAGSLQTPLAYLVCNFSSPGADKPATLTHDDVQTLFHECGHGLHHLLTQVDELPFSGINGVEWDAVELPSQFMENFCWEWDVVAGMTEHVDTGEPLPRALFDKMLAARNFQSGMHTVRQLEFAMFDLRLHSEVDASAGAVPFDKVMALLEDVREEVAVVRPPEWHRFPCSFGHIFAGGYAAGYYSYKWAEVLSADAYEAFEEASANSGSTLDAATGERFWREILAVGGSRPALESFKAFRGREPRVDALLRHHGMVGEAA